jgi:predicted dehydrogenase
LEPVTLCAEAKKHIQVQKPMATNLETARKMIETACNAGIQLGVVSQHRFDDSTQFLRRALEEGRLGKILQADAYVKWYRSPAYYSRPIKGSWKTEGGGALIIQAIHQVDVLLSLMGGISELFGYWQLAARHNIESEDVLAAVVKYETGATGVLQASTAFWPGHTERIELHGTKGTAIISGDKLTTWHVENDRGEPAPVSYNVASAATDPMGTALAPFERQFIDFGEAIRTGRKPISGGEEGYSALRVVTSVYESCRKGCVVRL